MNSAQRIHISEEDLASTELNGTDNARTSSRFALPVLGREAAVVVDADANRPKTSAQSTSINSSNDIENAHPKQKCPVAVIVVGMAGSGKSTLMAQLQRSLRAPNAIDPIETGETSEDDVNGNKVSQGSCSEDKTDDDDDDTTKRLNDIDDVETRNENVENELDRRRVGYCLNLDPATKLMPFAASIDIRDTVDYKVNFFYKTFVAPKLDSITCISYSY